MSAGGLGGLVQPLEQSYSHKQPAGLFGSCGTRFVYGAAKAACIVIGDAL